MSEEFKRILDQLIFFPQRSQIIVDFDLKNKYFQFTIPIFSCRTELSPSVKKYVEARKHHTFKPHVTSFQMEGEKKVLLLQKVPFSFSSQLGFRQEIDDFWKLAKKCHQMLSEIATEDKLKAALDR